MNAKHRLLSAFVLVSAAAALLMPLRSYATPFYSIVVLNSALLGGTNTTVADFNDVGQFTGMFTVDGAPHAFIYSGDKLQDLGTGPGSGGVAINDSGQVAGDFTTTGPFEPSHAFLYTNGSIQDLGTLGGNESHASGINNSGQVVGSSAVGGGVEHAFLYGNGTMKDLGTLPGAQNSFGYGINDSGQVTGVSFNYGGPGEFSRAFLYTNGVMEDLGTLNGGVVSEGIGISDNGMVTGQSTSADGMGQAFLYDNGTMHDIGEGAGYSVNDSGQVVGEGGVGGGFLYSDGSEYALNSLIGSASSCVNLGFGFKISNSGQILAGGEYDTKGTYYYHTFLLTPTSAPYSGTICDVSEPGTFALFGLGLVGVGVAMAPAGSIPVVAGLALGDRTLLALGILVLRKKRLRARSRLGVSRSA